MIYKKYILTTLLAISFFSVANEQEEFPILNDSEIVTVNENSQQNNTETEKKDGVLSKQSEELKECLNEIRKLNLSDSNEEIKTVLDGMNSSLQRIAIALEKSNNQITKVFNNKANKVEVKKLVPKSKPIAKSKDNSRHLTPFFKVNMNKVTINSLYVDQAWIKVNDSVYIVNVGDTVGDMLIKSIQPSKGIVLTSKGTIKQLN